MQIPLGRDPVSNIATWAVVASKGRMEFATAAGAWRVKGAPDIAEFESREAAAAWIAVVRRSRPSVAERLPVPVGYTVRPSDPQLDKGRYVP